MASPGVERQARILVAVAGGYLRNIVREPQVTCAVCATPVYGGYGRCYQCSRARQLRGLADLVVPLSYAVAGEQSGTMMRHYKDDRSDEVRLRHSGVIQRLLFVGLGLHQQCIGRVLGRPVDRRLAVPSTAGRTGVHPFVAMARDMRAVDPAPGLIPGSAEVGQRVIAVDRFAIDPPSTRFDGEHVLILDDTWTSGANTQSAAQLVRRLGAVNVSIVTVARWFDPHWKDNQTFVRQRLRSADFDPFRCPVTGGACPT